MPKSRELSRLLLQRIITRSRIRILSPSRCPIPRSFQITNSSSRPVVTATAISKIRVKHSQTIWCNRLRMISNSRWWCRIFSTHMELWMEQAQTLIRLQVLSQMDCSIRYILRKEIIRINCSKMMQTRLNATWYSNRMWPLDRWTLLRCRSLQHPSQCNSKTWWCPKSSKPSRFSRIHPMLSTAEGKLQSKTTSRGWLGRKTCGSRQKWPQGKHPNRSIQPRGGRTNFQRDTQFTSSVMVTTAFPISWRLRSTPNQTCKEVRNRPRSCRVQSRSAATSCSRTTKLRSGRAARSSGASSGRIIRDVLSASRLSNGIQVVSATLWTKFRWVGGRIRGCNSRRVSRAFSTSYLEVISTKRTSFRIWRTGLKRLRHRSKKRAICCWRVSYRWTWSWTSKQPCRHHTTLSKQSRSSSIVSRSGGPSSQ